MIGMATVENNYPLYYEATNECGLSVAGLNFPGLAHYQNPSPDSDNVAVFELIPWLLSQCANVSQVKDLLRRINLADTPFSSDFPVTPLHWLICDHSCCISVESVEDGLKIYDNPVGVLTNCPDFSYHLNHLKDYQNLSPLPPTNLFAPAVDLTPYGGAMGAIGLPGDWSSASRFVRAAFVKLNSPQLSSEEDAVNQFFRILQSVAMPMGSVQVRPGVHDITRYSCCCNTKTCRYYYTTYANSRITCVDMWQEDINGKQIIAYSLNDKPDILIQNQR